MEPTINQTPVIESKGHGALIGSIIIVLLLVVGGAYYFMSSAKEAKERREQMENITPEEDSITTTLSVQSTDDEITSIANDIEATDFSTLDEGIE